MHENKFQNWKIGETRKNPKGCTKKCTATLSCLNQQGFQDWTLAKYELEMKELREERQGIVNVGSTCFANAMLQVLFWLTPLRRAILAVQIEKEKDRFVVLQHLQRFIKEFYSPFKSITIAPMINDMKLNPKIQQDAGEFMKVIFKAITRQTAQEFDWHGWNVPIQTTPGQLTHLLHQLTHGSSFYTTKCLECNSEYPGTTDDFSEVTVPLAGKPRVSVETLIQDYLSPAMMDENSKFKGCTTPGCEETKASRQLKLKKLPTVLFLQLERFGYDAASGQFPKINATVDVSEELLLDGQESYELFAIVHHKGPSANHGHYFVSLKDVVVNEWIRVDDTESGKLGKTLGEVEPVKGGVENVLSSKTAYFLCYVKKNCPGILTPPLLSKSAYPPGLPSTFYEQDTESVLVDDDWYGIPAVNQFRESLKRQLDNMELVNQRVKDRFEWERAEKASIVKIWQTKSAGEKAYYLDKDWIHTWLEPLLLKRKTSGTEEPVGGSEEDLFTAMSRFDEEGSESASGSENGEAVEQVVLSTVPLAVIPMQQHVCQVHPNEIGLAPSHLSNVKRITKAAWEKLTHLPHPPPEVQMPDEVVEGEFRYTADVAISNVCRECEKEEKASKIRIADAKSLMNTFVKAVANPNVLAEQEEFNDWIMQDGKVWIGKKYFADAKKALVHDGGVLLGPTQREYRQELICEHDGAQTSTSRKQTIPFVVAAWWRRELEKHGIHWQLQFQQEASCDVCKVLDEHAVEVKQANIQVMIGQLEDFKKLPKRNRTFEKYHNTWNPSHVDEGFLIPKTFLRKWISAVQGGEVPVQADLYFGWMCVHDGLLVDPVREQVNYTRREEFVPVVMITPEEREVLVRHYPLEQGDWGLHTTVAENVVFSGERSTCYECWDARMSHSWIKCTIDTSATLHGPGVEEEEDDETGDFVTRTTSGRISKKQKLNKKLTDNQPKLDFAPRKSKRTSRRKKAVKIPVEARHILREVKELLEPQFQTPAVYQTVYLVKPRREGFTDRVRLDNGQETLETLGIYPGCQLIVECFDQGDEDAVDDLELAMQASLQETGSGTVDDDEALARVLAQSMVDQ